MTNGTYVQPIPPHWAYSDCVPTAAVVVDEVVVDVVFVDVLVVDVVVEDVMVDVELGFGVDET